MIQKKPLAVCTACGAVSYIATLINGPCGRRRRDGNRCRGINDSALNETDWATCDGCAGSGRVGDGGSPCDRCDGVGWLFVRRYYS